MEIIEKHFSFISSYDDVPIHGICMIPEKPIGIFQMVHGMCEHKERFRHMMKFMAEHGYVALMHDNRGHGESLKDPMDLGYCYESGVAGYVEDIFRVNLNIRNHFKDLPIILYGHSMGSLGARAYLKYHDSTIDGLVLSGSPSYNEAFPAGATMLNSMLLAKGGKYRSELMQKFVTGSFENAFKKEGVKNAWITSDKKVVDAYNKDPLCQFTYTLNADKVLMDLIRITYLDKKYNVDNPNLPIRFFSGDDDPCYVDDKHWDKAMDHLMDLGYTDVSGVRYVGMRHEIHNEIYKQTAFNDILQFCNEIIEE